MSARAHATRKRVTWTAWRARRDGAPAVRHGGRRALPRPSAARGPRALALRALAAALALTLLPVAPSSAQGGLPTREVVIGSERFRLEVAADPAAMYRGLGGRRTIPRNGGMLFVHPAPRPLAMVMRDCPIPIDVAFLDAEGRVLNVHTMPPEPPRRPGEDAIAYEARLPSYPSAGPAQYAIELAGGRFAELGVKPGDRIDVAPAASAPHD